MSSPSNTTARSPSSSDRAALAQAVKLIAGKPGMSPASALRKAGIKSAAKIKQLSVELRRQQTERDQRKASDAGGRRQSNGGQATATAKALNTSRGASKKGARSPEPVKPRKSVRARRRNDGTIGRRSPKRYDEQLAQTLRRVVVPDDAVVATRHHDVRPIRPNTPSGISLRCSGFPTCGSDGAAAQPERRRCRPR